jgi:hypothetical protein
MYNVIWPVIQTIPAARNTQKEKDDREFSNSFSAGDSGGRDRFCMTPEQPE